MKFPRAMLLDYVETAKSAEEIGDLLTMAGFELEGIDEVDGDAVLDIKVMSNRGDGLSVFGLAREVLAKDPEAQSTALYERAVARFPMDDRGDLPTRVDLETKDCTRYACRLFQDVVHAETPAWIRKRLEQAGQRSLGLLVDLTNYVMLEVGQPLHAFDLDTLAEGRIVVRKARSGEKLTTLNGVEHTLNPGQTMICDAEKPVAAAGIMGGLATEVTDGTRRILLESAHFENTSTRRTRKELGLSTEASYRFERSVDPAGVVAALNRFAQLLAEVDGGRSLVPGVLDVYPEPVVPAPVSVALGRVRSLLGMDVREDEMVRYLGRLGFDVSSDGKTLTAVPPTWRPDVRQPEDIVEEIGRVHGYDRIPEVLPEGSSVQGGVQGFELFVDHLRAAVLRAGFDQAISHSLRDRSPFDAPGERVGPRNPGSPDMAWLRNSHWPALAEAARRNGARDLHFFEIGRIHRPAEEVSLGLLSTGRLLAPARANEPGPEADFFSLKGAIAGALRLVGVGLRFEPTPEPDPRLHPTRQAAIVAESGSVGVLGQIHPDLAEESGLMPSTVLAEIALAPAYAAAHETPRLAPISRNPAVRRDLSFQIARSVPFSEIEHRIAASAGDVLERMWLFDVYRGAGIPDDAHSLSVALTLRKLGENFTDEEANQVRERVVAALAELGATMR